MSVVNTVMILRISQKSSNQIYVISFMLKSAQIFSLLSCFEENILTAYIIL